MRIEHIAYLATQGVLRRIRILEYVVIIGVTEL